MANLFSFAGPNSKYNAPNSKPAGFWAGLWHGLILPIAFIISMFNPNVRIYEPKNKGFSYDFGFIVGVSGTFGSSGSRVLS